MLVSIIIPVYNEAKTISEVLSELLNLGIDKEVILVDDGSTDFKYQQGVFLDPRISIIRHSRNRGKGAALRTGLAAAKGDLAVFFDADMEYRPEDILALTNALSTGSHSVCYGSRFLGKSRFYPLNYLANRLITKLTSLSTGLRLTDVETGMKAFNKAIFDRIKLMEDGFAIEIEVTIKLAKAGYQIQEVPIDYCARNRKQGKKITWFDGIKALIAILRYGITKQ
ncbi:MAG: glycosyltransferase family 2 protein [Candidatus Omnitrophota bacterium]